MTSQARMKVKKTMVTETAHRLSNYSGKCAHVHGHSYRWEVEVEAVGDVLLENGMVLDFGDLKRAMKRWIYDVYDHALVLDVKDPLYSAPEMRKSSDGEVHKVVGMLGSPTAENLASQVALELQDELDLLQGPRSYRVLRVVVWETANSCAEWAASDI